MTDPEPGLKCLQRRQWLAATGVWLATTSLGNARSASASCLTSTSITLEKNMRQPLRNNRYEPFGYCLNTSSIRAAGGQELPLEESIRIAAEVGYQAIEPWIREIDAHVAAGGTLEGLRRQIEDAGLVVASAIGFPEWISDDDAKRSKGLDEAKRNMEQVAVLGGKYLAAPPAGAQGKIELERIGERYLKLLELGDSTGVTPQLELWGFSQTLSKLSEVLFVAAETKHAKACLLLDAYHLYKGGSNVESLRLVQGTAMHCFHINDYPGQPPRETITDADRVFPGDGVAPLGTLFEILHAAGYTGYLSLELFNRGYWQRDPREVAREGLEKTRLIVRQTMERVLG